MKAVFTLVSSLLFQIAFASDSIPLRKFIHTTQLVTIVCGIQKYHLNKNKFSYPEIAQVNLKRKGSVGRGILFGALAGAGIGALVGLVTYQEPECEQGSFICLDFGPGFSAAGGAAIGALGGGLIGGLIGAGKKKNSSMEGKKEKFEATKMSVLEWAYSR